MVEAKFINAVI